MGCVLAIGCSSSIGDGPPPLTGKPVDATGSSGLASGSAAGSATSSPGRAPAAPTAPGQRLPDIARPIAYDLRLELDPDSEAFRGTVAIEIELARPTDHVWLHADDLVIAKASYRAGSRSGPLVDLAIANDDDMRAFKLDTQLSGKVTLTFEYSGHVAKDEPEGLFRQQAKSKWYLFAQSESVFARRILPCFDEPRWKPAWRVTLVVPDKLVALGNGAVISETAIAGGKREVKLAEVTSMASYLLSVAVGPFAIVDVGKVGRNRVPARVVVPAGNERNVAIVPAKLPAVVDALENYLDRPLPLAKLDLVAVPKFFGAMENTGLVTFEASILIGDPKKWWVPRRFIRFAAHELAHQWFGNQVTQVWWDDLWLAEGFSTWLGDKISDELGAYNDPAMRRALARLHALGEDDDATPRPLRRPIDSEGVEDRFDAIAYEKGGALLEMIEEFVGTEKFRDAIRAYVVAHDGRHVTSRDVVRALEPVSADAAAAMQTYLDLGGAPVVTLRVECTASPAIEVRSSAGTIPVCVRYPDGATIARACVVASATRGTIKPAACPAWVIGNANGDGYYRIANPAVSAKAPMTPSERLTYADDLAAATLRGELSITDALREAKTLMAGDTASALGAANIAAAIDPLVEEALRPAWSRWITTRFAARAKAKGPPTGVEAALKEQLWELLPARGPGKPWFDKIVAKAKAAPEARHEAILENLGELSPDLAPHVVDLALAGTFKPEKLFPAIAAMLARPVARSAMWRALRDRLPKLAASVAAVELEELLAATASLCDQVEREQVVAAFTNRVPAPKLSKPLASIDRCVARRGKLGDLAAALKRA